MTSPRERVARCRARRRAGLVLLPQIEVDEDAVVEWLLDTGFLKARTEDLSTIAQALREGIGVWSRR